MAKAYFSHSASEEDKEIEKFFEATLKMFGVSIYKIEGDDFLTPPLEKIEDTIKKSDFVFAILTKRHKRLAYGQYGWRLKEMKLHLAVLVALGITLMFFRDPLRAVAGIGVVRRRD